MAGCPARATADAGVAEASRASAKVDQITEQTKRFQAATEQRFHQLATRLDRVIDDLGPIKGAHAGNAAGEEAALIARDLGLRCTKSLTTVELLSVTDGVDRTSLGVFGAVG